mmetsp:Transcript_34223/g.88401  ORF Transcript_34223/g.88401 Transcript_34223/m.88401 type:complete len:246 (+) Transcript_34223:295-1032(+)
MKHYHFYSPLLPTQVAFLYSKLYHLTSDLIAPSSLPFSLSLFHPSVPHLLHAPTPLESLQVRQHLHPHRLGASVKISLALYMCFQLAFQLRGEASAKVRNLARCHLSYFLLFLPHFLLFPHCVLYLLLHLVRGFSLAFQFLQCIPRCIVRDHSWLSVFCYSGQAIRIAFVLFHPLSKFDVLAHCYAESQLAVGEQPVLHTLQPLTKEGDGGGDLLQGGFVLLRARSVLLLCSHLHVGGKRHLCGL